METTDTETTDPRIPYDRTEAVRVLERRGHRFSEYLATQQQDFTVAALTEDALVRVDGGLPNLTPGAFLLLFARLLLAQDLASEGSLAEAVAGLVTSHALREQEVPAVRDAYRAYGLDAIADALDPDAIQTWLAKLAE